MRLLKPDGPGSYCLTDKLRDDSVPQYAILSHRWGPDEEEVTFNDLIAGVADKKVGFEKIIFCGEQTARDGLGHFWVDSCCINKSTDAELVESIRSMFRWYQRATKCYVYLSDVSVKEDDPQASQSKWESDFRRSEWFTRGWTLQELLAPASVEFFSKQGKRLGDKKTLEKLVHEITSIPVSALRGHRLSDYSIQDRMMWVGNRVTTREEDRAYCLVGLFGISMNAKYGEGRHAIDRLQVKLQRLESDKKELYLYQRQLRVTDPRDDKSRIEADKGGLLEQCYQWILRNAQFEQWKASQQNQLLWIRGDPGKGKTMLLCGIINELEKQQTGNVVYFFFQATQAQINSAIACLRSLMFMLFEQQPSLISYMQKVYDQAGEALFQDGNTWFALKRVFELILQDSNLRITYLIIDALDECITDLDQLLELIGQLSTRHSRVRWIVSSRNWPSIEAALTVADNQIGLRLELNERSISAAVADYIAITVDRLTQRKHYNSDVRNAVQYHLASNAQGTFLWVALVCKALHNISARKVKSQLTEFPSGLEQLYGRIVDRIWNEDADDVELCRSILAVASTVYRPLTFDELASIVHVPDDSSGDDQTLMEVLGLCGSFLTFRNHTIFFVHQSAKDFLVKQASGKIFPSGIEEIHHTIFTRSLLAMSEKLRRNVYTLSPPGFPINHVKQPDPDPLAAVRYSCVYWADHLHDSHADTDTDETLQDGGLVHLFLCRSYLHWLEALSLLRSTSAGIMSLAKLNGLLQVRLTYSGIKRY
jgi:hypothetical protein